MDDPTRDPTGKRHDLALDDRHWIDWLEEPDGTRTGLLMIHVSVGTSSGLCGGSVHWKASRYELDHPEKRKFFGELFTLHGQADSQLTLSPSLLCRCGEHGFVRYGRWIAA